MCARRIAARHGFCFTPRQLGAWRIHGNNYSLDAISSADTTRRMTSRITEVIRAEPDGLFPSDYDRLLIRRLHFGIARIAARNPNGKRSTGLLVRLAELSGGTRLDWIMVRLANLTGPISTFLTITWLTMRLHPYSLLQLALEPLRRRIARSRLS
jgi:hypothetical protein